jgi:hypothetical protein
VVLAVVLVADEAEGEQGVLDAPVEDGQEGLLRGQGGHGTSGEGRIGCSGEVPVREGP